MHAHHRTTLDPVKCRTCGENAVDDDGYCCVCDDHYRSEAVRLADEAEDAWQARA